MNSKAFTLIEVMVVMAIISILAGMMTPVVWRYWESEDIATTRQRMKDIKAAMIGDRNFVQNGVRTSFGFVGDNGELPFGNHSSSAGNLSYLVNRPIDGYPFWNGPYLSGQSSDWYRDAWGNVFLYTASKDATDRYVTALLHSAGPDRVFGSSDDIIDQEFQIAEYEVLTAGNITSKIPSGSGSLNFEISFRDPSSGLGTASGGCFKLETFSRYTTVVLPRKLPIGGIDVQYHRHSSENCGDISPVKSKSKYYADSGKATIYCPAD